MTSNQIAYWNHQETVRANKAKEAETQRHNVSDENIRTLANELNERGIEVKDREALTRLYELYAKYGFQDLSNMPPEARQAIEDAFGLPIESGSQDANWYLGNIAREIKDVLGGFGQVLKAMF